MCGHIVQEFPDLTRLEQQSMVNFQYKITSTEQRVDSYFGDYLPGEEILVIATSSNPNKPGRLLTKAKWGLEIGNNYIYNARMENLQTKDLWRNPTTKRVIVPVTSFWEQNPFDKQEYEFRTEFIHGTILLLGLAVLIAPGERRVVISTCETTANSDLAKFTNRSPYLTTHALRNYWLDPVMPNSMFATLGLNGNGYKFSLLHK